MGTTTLDRQCTFILPKGTRCTTGAARGSTICQRHIGKEPSGPMKAPVVRLPAKPRGGAHGAHIVLADPVVVNPPEVMNGHAPVSFEAIDRMISEYETDLAALKRVRVIVTREAYEPVG